MNITMVVISFVNLMGLSLFLFKDKVKALIIGFSGFLAGQGIIRLVELLFNNFGN